ncbi:MAG: 3'(2'),5'-bisphosphate nucleotidase CysQ [Actinomycetota bacterium]|nr:3'(2'),5'-bisphosphate nucleotidase CysQ [Actinomycetota bacterium]
MNTPTDLQRIETALDTARSVLKDFTPGRIASTRKQGGDPVTEADVAVDEALRSILLTGGEGWLSEETTDDLDRLEHSRVWIVDPIDGTREFIEGIPEWCVSIGLAVDGRPVAGGIMNPATEERIVGDLTAPPSYEGPREPATATTVETASILASRSEIRRGEWDRFIDKGLDVVPMGSVAYKLALVAAGRADATWTLVPKREWDVAAGVALLASAGSYYRRKDSSPVVFNAPETLLPGFIAARQEIADEVEQLLVPHT